MIILSSQDALKAVIRSLHSTDPQTTRQSSEQPCSFNGEYTCLHINHKYVIIDDYRAYDDTFNYLNHAYKLCNHLNTINSHIRSVKQDQALFSIFFRMPISMMTASNRNIVRVTVPLCVEFIDHRWIPLTKASDAELWCFFFCFFNLHLNRRLSKQSRRWWCETPSRSLWRHRNAN